VLCWDDDFSVVVLVPDGAELSFVVVVEEL
jgi:hypothetical protein